MGFPVLGVSCGPPHPPGFYLEAKLRSVNPCVCSKCFTGWVISWASIFTCCSTDTGEFIAFCMVELINYIESNWIISSEFWKNSSAKCEVFWILLLALEFYFGLGKPLFHKYTISLCVYDRHVWQSSQELLWRRMSLILYIQSVRCLWNILCVYLIIEMSPRANCENNKV